MWFKVLQIAGHPQQDENDKGITSCWALSAPLLALLETWCCGCSLRLSTLDSLEQCTTEIILPEPMTLGTLLIPVIRSADEAQVERLPRHSRPG